MPFLKGLLPFVFWLVFATVVIFFYTIRLCFATMLLFAAMRTFFTQLDCVFNHSTIEPLALIEWSRVRLLISWKFLFVFLYIGIPYLY